MCVFGRRDARVHRGEHQTQASGSRGAQGIPAHNLRRRPPFFSVSGFVHLSHKARSWTLAAARASDRGEVIAVLFTLPPPSGSRLLTTRTMRLGGRPHQRFNAEIAAEARLTTSPANSLCLSVTAAWCTGCDCLPVCVASYDCWRRCSVPARRHNGRDSKFLSI